jgi:hypothetical protein
MPPRVRVTRELRFEIAAAGIAARSAKSLRNVCWLVSRGKASMVCEFMEFTAPRYCFMRQPKRSPRLEKLQEEGAAKGVVLSFYCPEYSCYLSLKRWHFRVMRAYVPIMSWHAHAVPKQDAAVIFAARISAIYPALADWRQPGRGE